MELSAVRTSTEKWSGFFRSIPFKLLGKLPNRIMSAGPSNERVVALTFDDGPDPDTTPDILNILKKNQVKATFFLLGRHVQEHPAVARDVVAEGHSIGTHTFSHALRINRNPLCFRREIIHSHRLIARVTGKTPEIFRPPQGRDDPLLFTALRILMGYSIILWSVSAKDWRGDSAGEIIDRVLTGVKPGGIVCFHDGCGDCDTDLSRDRTPTVVALPKIIEQLRSKGYGFVTIPEMMALVKKRQ